MAFVHAILWLIFIETNIFVFHKKSTYSFKLVDSFQLVKAK